MGNPVHSDPYVKAARIEFEKIWRELGSPNPIEGSHHVRAQIEAARRVYRAVFDKADTAVEERRQNRNEKKFQVI